VGWLEDEISYIWGQTFFLGVLLWGG